MFVTYSHLNLLITHLLSADLVCADYKTLMLDFTFGLSYADCFKDLIFLVGAEKKAQLQHFIFYFFAFMRIGAPVTKTMYDKPVQIKRL